MIIPVPTLALIGTTTVGSQTQYINEDGDRLPLFFEFSIGVNRFSLPEILNGDATAYVYAYNSDYWGRCSPVIYSDNNNVPLTRRSASEGNFDIEVRSGKAAGWRSATFKTNTSISNGSNVWFGLFCEWFAPRFDYGQKCYWDLWDHLGNSIPNTYPVWSANWFYDFKLSMYFTYTSAQNYMLTLTQGVNLNDAGKIEAEYRRTAAQTARLNDTQNLITDYKREAAENVNGITAVNALFSFFRQCFESVGNNAALARLPVFNRFVSEGINASDGNKNNRELNIRFEDTSVIADTANRNQGFFRGIIDGIKLTDNIDFQVLFVRTLQETQGITDTFRQVRNYIRCLYVGAGNLAETACGGNSYRTINDTVQAEGAVFRHLLIFVKILSTSFVRDFIIQRFLVAREELVLKSYITREITLDSKIN